ncbi:MAG TPA: transcription-repair coupling factor, partial [Microscillaceae bacterium]|nr:transcription-repair coupling factor [Microscillaceae bacterium]
KTHFEAQLPKFVCIEFGKKYHQKAVQTIQLTAKPQPSFNKDFSLLVKNLQEFQQQGFQHFIAAESYKQIDRLRTIFEELDPQLRFQALPVALREGFIDLETKTLCYTDHQIFERFHRYRTAERFAKSKALTLRELRTLQPGDYVTHIDYGIGRFAGLEKTEVNGKQQEVIRLVYRDNDLLFVNIHALHKIAKYAGKESTPPSISKLGSGEWENKKRKVKRQVQDIAKNLISLYAKRRSAAGCAFSPDSFLQAELESSFLYEDTPDQAKATQHVKEDMEKPYPMDRLVCGDVGFGKTEVAIRAAFKAICDNKQVAVLVPTTILALQHYKTFRERLEKFPCKIEYINRFRNSTQIKETLKNIETGETQILIGTHRIVNKDVKFKDLGLLIIDEEQKFGVKVKDKIKEMRVNVDVLTLTATPIPRTLQFSMMGARDLSIIATPPTNRQPVTTELHTFNEAVIRDAITYEIRRGGQVFFVHNRVNDIDSIANMILKLVPDARIGVAHGQMEGSRLEKVMLKFIEGEYDLLISTNIIESGLDIPNANTIIINMAHMFGLSDLHQMRGRVGRSNKKAFCYLLTPASSLLSTDARKRLQALEEFSDLGDGFKIAMRDLDIRGAGNLLGAEQSGFINDLGFETYHKILDEAVQELKDTEFKELFLPSSLSLDQQQYLTDCNVETDLQILIPDSYVQNISERLSLYSQLDSLKDEAALLKFEKDLQDRFGIIPDEVRDLLQTVRLRWIAEKIGFEKLTLKNQTLKGFFMATKEDYFKGEQFGKVILFLQNQPQKARLKDYNGKPMLILPHLNTIQQAIDILSAML